jgi:hypothetical protein
MNESFTSSFRSRDKDGFDSGMYDYDYDTTLRPSNSTTKHRSNSRSPSAPSGRKSSKSISPMSPSDWVMSADNHCKSDDTECLSLNLSRSKSTDMMSGADTCSNTFLENLRVIPISPMMEDSVDDTWDFDFDQGRGSTTINTSRKPLKSESIFPDLSPRSSDRQQASLFSPVSTPSPSPSLRETPRKDFLFRRTNSTNSNTSLDSLQNKKIPRIQSAKAQPNQRNRNSNKETSFSSLSSFPSSSYASSSSVGHEQEDVDTDSWAFKMIRHHSEPSLRPKCRQSTRSFYEQPSILDNSNSKTAGPAYLSTSIDPNIVSNSLQNYHHHHMHKAKSDARLLARINSRNMSSRE